MQKAEAITLKFARPLILFDKIMYPFIWLLNSTAIFFHKTTRFRTCERK
ncbi:hypothetical protein ACU82A_16710 [Bacillus cereus]